MNPPANPSPTAVRLRRMTLADLDRVLEIAASLKDAPQWSRAAYMAALDPEAAPRRIALVAEEAGAVEAFAVASLLPPQAELETIGVSSAAQRRGWARLLFGALLAEVRALAAELGAVQVTEFFLEARASNQPALGLYQRLGFVQTGLRTRYYHDPVEDAVLMCLRLQGA